MQKSFLLLFILSAFLSAKAQTPDTGKPDSVIHLKGGQIRLTPFGFPEQIRVTDPADSLLAENIHFHFTRQSDGKDIRLKSEGVQFTKKTPQKRVWKSVATSDELRMVVTASLDNGGPLIYSVQVEVLSDLDIKDITMHIPFRKEMAGYMSGLGIKYGPRTDSMFLWKWKSAESGPEKVWIGIPKTGLQYTLAGGPDWTNEGKGGIGIGIKGKSMLANNYTGPRHLQKGDTLRYNFNLSITPGE
jgi:predicted RNase H-related nuclease YkuK (DUF458 family)